MDQQHFDYNGWQFERHDDGSVTILPKVQQEGQGFTAESKKQITIPSNDLPRLVSYLLTGRVDEEVAQQITNLGRVGQTV